MTPSPLAQSLVRKCETASACQCSAVSFYFDQCRTLDATRICIGSKQKPRTLSAAKSALSKNNYAFKGAAFFFLRRPSRPNPARPVAKSGRAPGSGIGGGDGPPTSPEEIPTVAVPAPPTNASRVAKAGKSVVVVQSTGSVEPTGKAAVNAALPALVSTNMDPKNFGRSVLSCKKLQCRAPVR